MEALLFVFGVFGAYVIYAIITDNNEKTSKEIIHSPNNIHSSIYSESDIQRVGLYVKRLIDIIHESIDIARKSTNTDTKISRLKLANDKLKDIHDYISRYPSITLTNLDNLQATINDLHDQFKISGIYDIAEGNVLTARDLLKQATQLKKENRFNEACDKLKEAYSAYGSNELMMKDLLRLPMYLQLAGRSQEGWEAINVLRKQSNDAFDQVEIANQIQIFLRKEKKYKLAVLFAAWASCEIVSREEFNVKNCIDLADMEATDEYHISLIGSLNTSEVYGHTPSGHPITQYAYNIFSKRLSESKTIDAIRSKLEKDLSKTDCSDALEQLSIDLHNYITNNNKYKLNEVILIVNKYVIDDEINTFQM